MPWNARTRKKPYSQLPVFWETTWLLCFCSLLEPLGGEEAVPTCWQPLSLSRGLWGTLGDLLRLQGWSGPGQKSRVGSEMKAKHGFSFRRMSFVVVRSPRLWGSHKASNSFCVLLKRIQSIFQIWIECVCLKFYFLCKSGSKCEVICLSNCPSKETQA